MDGLRRVIRLICARLNKTIMIINLFKGRVCRLTRVRAATPIMDVSQ